MSYEKSTVSDIISCHVTPSLEYSQIIEFEQYFTRSQYLLKFTLVS